MKTNIRKKERALTFLASGEASLTEVARLANVSDTLLRYWATQARFDWQARRRRVVRQRWRDYK